MCFSLAWLQSVFVWIVVILAVLALLRLIAAALLGVPFWPLVTWPGAAGAAGPAPNAGGIAGFVLAAFNIFIWAFIAIVLIYFVFMLIGCLMSFTGGFPSLNPRRGSLADLLLLG